MNGDRIAPSASAANPECEGMGVSCNGFADEIFVPRGTREPIAAAHALVYSLSGATRGPAASRPLSALDGDLEVARRFVRRLFSAAKALSPAPQPTLASVLGCPVLPSLSEPVQPDISSASVKRMMANRTRYIAISGSRHWRRRSPQGEDF